MSQVGPPPGAARAAGRTPARRHPVRAALSLAVIALGMGLALAAALGAVIWLLSAALHSASSA